MHNGVYNMLIKKAFWIGLIFLIQSFSQKRHHKCVAVLHETPLVLYTIDYTIDYSVFEGRHMKKFTMSISQKLQQLQ